MAERELERLHKDAMPDNGDELDAGSRDQAPQARLLAKLRIKNDLARMFLAEFLGTAVLIIVGDGSVAQLKLGASGLGISFLSVNFAWALAVMLAVLISGGVSGGHVNPAISVAQWLMGRLTSVKLVVYLIAQYLGAFFGAAIVFFTYYQALDDVDANRTSAGLAGIFATYPAGYLNAWGGLIDQVVGTWLLATGVGAITDTRSALGVPSSLAPLYVGLLVGAIGMSYGVNCGYAINPARDFAPRLLSLAAGWSSDVTFAANWWWVPIVGPHVGAILGALTYALCVGNHN